MTENKLRFDTDTHSYWIGKRQLESVSSVVKSLCRPFDREGLSKSIAAKRGIDQKDLLAEWDAKAERARERGTMVHSYVEDVLDDNNDLLLSEMNVKTGEMRAFDGAWKAFRDRMRAKVAFKERMVFSENLGIAGRVDVALSVIEEGARRKCLFDWKTGKFRDRGIYGNLLPPFDDIGDCELSRYSIQLSLYRMLLEEEGESYGDGYLVHLKECGNYFIYRSADYRGRLRKWLKTRGKR